MVEIPVLKHQIEFLNSEATHTGLVAGFGAGKSKAATLKTIEKKKLYPKVDVAYYLPTYGLIKDIAYPNFSDVLTQMRIPYTLNRTDHEFQTPLGRIIMRSMDKPSTIVGYEVGYSIIDEADIINQVKMNEVLVKIVGRNRKPLHDGKPNAIDMVSTPEGFGFMYNFFVNTTAKNRKLIRAKTEDNPYLPESYLETLMQIYTEEQIKAYCGGEFINLNSGTVYYKFDRNVNHKDRKINEKDTLHVGLDFNIDQMAGVVHVVDQDPTTRKKMYIAVDEIHKAYDTEDVCNILKQRFPNNRIFVYPDASGNSRSTSGESDFQIIRKNGYTIKAPSKNPPVRDRVNYMNAAFRNAKDEVSYYVDINRCPEYTKALEQLGYKNGVPNKESGLDHITDGPGYFMYYENKPRPRITGSKLL